MVKASKNASPKSDVPKVAKKSTSLTKPRILESSVPPLTTEKLLKRLKTPIRPYKKYLETY
jgi:hypothetical protein